MSCGLAVIPETKTDPMAGMNEDLLPVDEALNFFED